jgi:four helix bundle protein
MRDFRTLEVWQKAHGLSLLIYKSTADFPKEEKFGLTSQIRRCSVSIEANIAEGCGRGGDQDFRRFLHIALGSASELDCELLLAKDLSFLDSKNYDNSYRELRSIKAMLSTLIRKIDSDSKNEN